MSGHHLAGTQETPGYRDERPLKRLVRPRGQWEERSCPAPRRDLSGALGVPGAACRRPPRNHREPVCPPPAWLSSPGPEAAAHIVKERSVRGGDAAPDALCAAAARTRPPGGEGHAPFIVSVPRHHAGSAIRLPPPRPEAAGEDYSSRRGLGPAVNPLLPSFTSKSLFMF